MHPIRSYMLFTFLFWLGIGMSITTYVPLLLDVGLSLGQVMLVNVFFWATVSLAELPTGMIADGKSRVWSIRASALFYTIGCFGYATVSGFWTAVCWEMTVGIGSAFLSGAQQAWLTDALARRGENHLLSRAFATSALWRAVGMIIGGTVSAMLGTINLRLGWVAAGIIVMLALGVSMTSMRSEGEPLKRMTETEAFHASVCALRGNSALLWAAAASTVFGLVLPFNLYWAPFFQEHGGLNGLTWIWGPMYAALALAGFLMRKWDMRQGQEVHWIIVATFLTGGGLCLIGYPSIIGWSLIIAMVHEFGRGLFDPAMDVFMQRHIESGYRATFGSLQSLISRAGFAVVLVCVWAGVRNEPANAFTINCVWIWAGALLVSAAVLLWLCKPKQHA